MELEPGMLVRSKAGHDRNCIYVIISVNDEYVYLADGEKRPVCRLKKKNKKHVQPVTWMRSESTSDDGAIRRAVQKCSKCKVREARED